MRNLMAAWAERREDREHADDRLVRDWLHANPMAPPGALWWELPLSGRRIRRSIRRQLTRVEAS